MLKLSGSYIPCFSVYVKSLKEVTQYSEVLLVLVLVLLEVVKSYAEVQ